MIGVCVNICVHLHTSYIKVVHIIGSFPSLRDLCSFTCTCPDHTHPFPDRPNGQESPKYQKAAEVPTTSLAREEDLQLPFCVTFRIQTRDGGSRGASRGCKMIGASGSLRLLNFQLHLFRLLSGFSFSFSFFTFAFLHLSYPSLYRRQRPSHNLTQSQFHSQSLLFTLPRNRTQTSQPQSYPKPQTSKPPRTEKQTGRSGLNDTTSRAERQNLRHAVYLGDRPRHSGPLRFGAGAPTARRQKPRQSITRSLVGVWSGSIRPSIDAAAGGGGGEGEGEGVEVVESDVGGRH